MSSLPPPWDPSGDADEQYRRASELDPSRPSEATRRAVLAHAARLAAARARRGWPSLAGVALRWQAVVGTIAAAVLAGVVIAPQFLGPRVLSESQLAPATAPATGSSREPAAAPAAQDALQAHAPAAPPSARLEYTNPPGPPVALERPGLASRATPVPSRESASTNAARAAPAPARSAGEAMTQLDAGQRADTQAVRVPSEEAKVAVTGLATAERAAAAPRPVPADPDTLRHAAEAGDLTALSAQLAAGGAIDARDAQGRTALLLATLHGQPRAVALLLADGADPNAADAQGTTPLQAAVAADEREIIALLRRYGAR